MTVRLESGALPTEDRALVHDFIAADLADGLEPAAKQVRERDGRLMAEPLGPGSWIGTTLDDFALVTNVWPSRCAWYRYLDGYVLRRVA